MLVKPQKEKRAKKAKQTFKEIMTAFIPNLIQELSKL